METVGTFEAKTHLSDLLDRVARGESFVITKHGRPIAQLAPIDAATKNRVRERAKAIEALRRYKRHKLPKGVTIRDLIDEGRRF